MASIAFRSETAAFGQIDRIAQLDAFVRAGYQRLEALDVPVFDHKRLEKPKLARPVVRKAMLLALPADLPREILTIDDWLAGKSTQPLDPVVMLSLLLRYLSAPIRMEPNAESLLHRAVPSARMLCPVRFLVLQKGAVGIKGYRYEAAFHALEPVGDLTGAASAFSGNLAIGCIASPAEIAPLYGDFSAFPSVLEAGHGFAQLGQLARMLGLATSGYGDRSALAAFTRSPDELPLYVVPLKLELGALGQVLPAEELQLAERPCPEVIVTGTGQAAAMLRGFGDGATQTQYAAPAQPIRSIHSSSGGQGALATLRARSSGNDRSGVAARLDQFEPGLFAGLLARFERMLKLRTALPGEDFASAKIACLRADLAPQGLYDSTGNCSYTAKNPADFLTRVSRMLPYRGMRYNLGTLAVSLMITADPVKAVDQLGGSALREIHLAAGAIAQDFSNAAGSFGLFSRPMRMMRESTLEKEIPLDGQLIYQALCGKSRRANFALELA